MSLAFLFQNYLEPKDWPEKKEEMKKTRVLSNLVQESQQF
jgi:hypothetical protein